MEGVGKFDQIFISNYRQDVTFVLMKSHFSSQVCRDLVANVVDFVATYICIFIPNSKTDVYRDGNSVVIVRTDSNLCPVKNLELYLVWGNILADSNESY